MEEKLIIWLQSHSSSFLDVFFKIVSMCATWIAVICFFILVIFVINKKFGLTFGIGFALTIGLNYLIKTIVAKPRPYVNNTTIVNKMTTIGYSMPSGHTVSAVFMVLTIIAILHLIKRFKIFEKTWFRVLVYSICVVYLVLTAISRMYLGQHYLSDIIVGLCLSTVCFFITFFVYKKIVKNK